MEMFSGFVPHFDVETDIWLPPKEFVLWLSNSCQKTTPPFSIRLLWVWCLQCVPKVPIAVFVFSTKVALLQKKNKVDQLPVKSKN
jgi:hypothetical protein